MLKLSYTGQYYPALPSGHRFPIEKYELIQQQLLHQGIVMPEQMIDPGPCPDEHIVRVHGPEYWQHAKSLQLPRKDVRALGLPLVRETVLRAQNSVHCTLVSAQHALEQGLGIHLGGGTHHAFANRPEGFCLLNDLAVAAAWLLHQQHSERILILDLDVHQGNGTASIFQEEPRVFTFSMHCRQNYPLRKERSDRDVELPAGMGNGQYLQILQKEVAAVLDSYKPDFIFYQAGVDVLQGDKLGMLALSKEGCLQRDFYVLQQCRQRGVPLVVTLVLWQSFAW